MKYVNTLALMMKKMSVPNKTRIFHLDSSEVKNPFRTRTCELCGRIEKMVDFNPKSTIYGSILTHFWISNENEYYRLNLNNVLKCSDNMAVIMMVQED